MSSNEKLFDTVIIGGGMTGLACALALHDKGYSVAVLEAESGLGGLLGSYHLDGFTIERYYHHFFRYDTALLELLERLNLRHRITWKKASTGYYYKGETYNLDTPREIFLYKHLTLWEKFRLTKAVLTIKRMKDFKKLDRVTAIEWLLENAGKGVYENFFAPLLKSKFGSAAPQISAAWLCARIKLRSNRKVTGEELGYIQEGFEEVIQKIDALASDSLVFLKNRVVEAITRDAQGIFSVHSGNLCVKSKSVVSTVAPTVLRSLYEFEPDYDKKLEKNRSQSVVCVLFGLKRSVLPTYWLNIRSDHLPFALLIEHTRFHRIPAYGGINLLYAASYQDGVHDPFYQLPDDEIIASYVEGLREEFGLDKNDVLWSRLSKAPAVGPIYTIHFLDNLLPYDTPVPGFFVAGMMTSYPERGISVSITQGENVAQKVLSFLADK